MDKGLLNARMLACKIIKKMVKMEVPYLAICQHILENFGFGKRFVLSYMEMLEQIGFIRLDKGPTGNIIYTYTGTEEADTEAKQTTEKPTETTEQQQAEAEVDAFLNKLANAQPTND